jgi:hypothetical protein
VAPRSSYRKRFDLCLLTFVQRRHPERHQVIVPDSEPVSFHSRMSLELQQGRATQDTSRKEETTSESKSSSVSESESTPPRATTEKEQ